MRGTKFYGIIAAAFMAGAFLASPELRAYAANTVFSTDIVYGQVKTADLAGNAVTAAKIKDGEVKAAEIATDAVGAAEIAGVTKLLFGECTITSNAPIASGGVTAPGCGISGLDVDDRAIAILNTSDNPSAYECLNISAANPRGGEVEVAIRNECGNPVTLGTAKIGVMVYDK
ncbi:MAG: hypothetical protein ACREBU_22730 [Nitrososphaera sp.]